MSALFPPGDDDMKPNQAAVFRVGTIVGVVLVAGCASSLPTTRFLEIVGNAVLTATTEQPVVVDVHYIEGRFPLRPSLDAIWDTLEEINGPGTLRQGLMAELHVDDESREKEWTHEELGRVVTDLWETGCADDIRCIRFVFLNGQLSDERRTYDGLAFGEFAFIFPDFGRSMARVEHMAIEVEPSARERYLVIHELGHVLGLVNESTPMLESRLPLKDDDPCQCHSVQEDSVMYYRRHFVERDALLEAEHYPYRFNAADMRDLRAHQEWLRGQMGSE